MLIYNTVYRSRTRATKGAEGPHQSKATRLTYTLRGAYYLTDRDSRPHRVNIIVLHFYGMAITISKTAKAQRRNYQVKIGHLHLCCPVFTISKMGIAGHT